MENQPLLVLLCLASAPPCRFRAEFAQRAVAIGRAYLLDLVVRCLSACGAVFRVLGTSVGPVRSALRQLKSSRPSSESFEVVQGGFLPSTAGRSLIGGTSACSGPLPWVTAPSLAFGMVTAVFRGCGWVTRGYGWLPVYPSFRSGRLRRLLYP